MSAQQTPVVRLISSPPLGTATLEAFRRRFTAAGSLLACISDSPANASCVSIGAGDARVADVVGTLLETVGPEQAQGRAFVLQLAHEDPSGAFSDELLRSIGVHAHGALRCPIFTARATAPISAWARARPIIWGLRGLSLGDVSPLLPFGGSQCVGLSLEAGPWTLLARAAISGGLDAHELQTIAAAVGGARSGFLDVAAYPAAPQAGRASIVLELGNISRTPLHRVLAVLELEARRYGGRLGAGALLSEAPLGVFIEALGFSMGLHLRPSQVIETHLSAAGA